MSPLHCIRVFAGLLLVGASLLAQEDDTTPAPRRSKKSTSKAEPSLHAKASASPRKKKHSSPSSEEETPSPKKTAKNSDPDATPHNKSHASPSPVEAESPTPKSTRKKEAAGEEEASPTPTATPHSAENATLDPEQLVDFEKQPARVQQIISTALELTKQNLTYVYGSADPANGGLDCSGFVLYVLTRNGIADVPRDASGQYKWVRKADNFEAVLSRKKESFEFDQLHPGDLLFWTGTYTTEKDPPVTHTMIYLGTEKKSGRRVMVGSSDGRTYDGVSRWGVSVFDFKPATKPPGPEAKLAPTFVGYGSVPGLSE
jgi:cell wall-associated NlpC family hydrolase